MSPPRLLSPRVHGTGGAASVTVSGTASGGWWGWYKSTFLHINCISSEHTPHKHAGHILIVEYSLVKCCDFQALLLVLPLIGAASAMYGYHAPAPAYHAPSPAYHAPAPVYKEEPSPYQYEYGVHDDYHGTNFNAGEVSDAYGNVEVRKEFLSKHF